jgi:hypothetical protein
MILREHVPTAARESGRRLCTRARPERVVGLAKRNAHAPLEMRSQLASSGRGRRCACGGLVGPTGECAACRDRRLARAQRGRGLEAAPASARTHDFGAVDVERKPGITHGQGGATNTFEDCPAAWRPNANAAAALGRSWVANVINGLTHLPTPMPAPVSALLMKHFHTTYDKDIAKIVRHYREINAALNSTIDFECETSCDADVIAYVYTVWTDLHLCPLWFRKGAAARANAIVHELAHDAAGRDDEAYAWQAKYKKLSVDDAIDNADSYSHFAQEAYGP